MDETNRFAEQNGEIDCIWWPVKMAEICVFFALKMLGDIVKMSDQETNWLEDEQLQRPIFWKLISLKSHKIKQYLFIRFSANAAAMLGHCQSIFILGIIKLSIQNCIKFMMFNENFMKCYTLKEDLSTGKSLCHSKDG